MKWFMMWLSLSRYRCTLGKLEEHKTKTFKNSTKQKVIHGTFYFKTFYVAVLNSYNNPFPQFSQEIYTRIPCHWNHFLDYTHLLHGITYNCTYRIYKTSQRISKLFCSLNPMLDIGLIRAPEETSFSISSNVGVGRNSNVVLRSIHGSGGARPSHATWKRSCETTEVWRM